MWVYVSHPASPTVTQTVRQTVTPTDSVLAYARGASRSTSTSRSPQSLQPQTVGQFFRICNHFSIWLLVFQNFTQVYSSHFFFVFFFVSFLTSMTLHEISTLWFKSRLISHNRKWGSDVPKSWENTNLIIRLSSSILGAFLLFSLWEW